MQCKHREAYIAYVCIVVYIANCNNGEYTEVSAFSVAIEYWL